MRYSKLIGFRNELGKTQKQFAELLGITPQAYCRKELGKVKFNIDEISIISKFIKSSIPNITIEEIFFHEKS